MTATLIYLAWVVGQLCLLPVAPARYLHDLMGYLLARYYVGKHGGEVRVGLRGYRLNWLVKWGEAVPDGAKRSTLLLPVLLGLGVFTIGSPFWKALWFTSLPGLSFWERAAVQFVGFQVVALPFPRVRDVPRWRAWLPDPPEEEAPGERAEP